MEKICPLQFLFRAKTCHVFLPKLTVWVREKWKQDDTGQAVTSSAGAATDLDSSNRGMSSYKQGQAICLMKVASNRTLSSGNEIKMYIAKHKSLLTFHPPWDSWWYWWANNALFDHCIKKLLDPKCVQEKVMNIHTYIIPQLDVSEKAHGQWVTERDFKLSWQRNFWNSTEYNLLCIGDFWVL